jgi:hypothetical protein
MQSKSDIFKTTAKKIVEVMMHANIDKHYKFTKFLEIILPADTYNKAEETYDEATKQARRTFYDAMNSPERILNEATNSAERIWDEAKREAEVEGKESEDAAKEKYYEAMEKASKVFKEARDPVEKAFQDAMNLAEKAFQDAVTEASPDARQDFNKVSSIIDKFAESGKSKKEMQEILLNNSGFMNWLKEVVCKVLKALNLHNVERLGIKEFYEETTSKHEFKSFVEKVAAEKYLAQENNNFLARE